MTDSPNPAHPTPDRPLILVSNDDGVHAPGIAALEEALRQVGDVAVCAPTTEQSAKGHSINIDRCLIMTEHHRDGILWARSLDGTPADCIKFALTHWLKDRKPDLVVSGVNRGRNTGSNVLYSGTVGAAAEGMLYGIPSIAVSLAVSVQEPDIDFSFAADCAARLARQVLSRGLPEGIILNMNVPYGPPESIQGATVSRMSRSVFIDRFHQTQLQDGRMAFRNTGDWMRFDETCEDNDDLALARRQVSITPLRFDLTDHAMSRELAHWLEEWAL